MMLIAAVFLSTFTEIAFTKRVPNYFAPGPDVAKIIKLMYNIWPTEDQVSYYGAYSIHNDNSDIRYVTMLFITH